MVYLPLVGGQSPLVMIVDDQPFWFWLLGSFGRLLSIGEEVLDEYIGGVVGIVDRVSNTAEML